MVSSPSVSPIENIRHSLAHLLAAAVKNIYKDGAKLALGPAIDDGFYYDIEFPAEIRIGEKELKKIEAQMRALIKSWHGFEKLDETAESARARYAGNPYKLELIEEIISRNEPLTSYQSGDFVDLCRGGHVGSIDQIDPKAFKLDRVAGAYWRGDEKNKMLTRIYGLAFDTGAKLAEYVERREEAKKRDHKILGPKLDLFTFSDLVGSGLPLWTPRGTLVRDLLDAFVWELRKKAGYQRVEIPHITKKDLYEMSGHWDKFKDELFKISTREGHVFAMKPMNCPHHTQIYARRQWSYRELPQRYANTTACYRDEQTGELSGLARVRAFSQDDAHVFCRMNQAETEFLKIWDIVHTFYGVFGFSLRVRLSLHDPKHPEKFLGDKKRWEYAEGILRKIVTEKNTDFFEGVGEAAFYGPKIDFMAKDSLGRELQVATIQLDMNMPERFDLTCVGEDGKPERIVMIHAAIMGSIERFLSVLIEHTAGAFPLWLSPVQAAVLPVSDKFSAYASSVTERLTSFGLRVEIDDRNESVGKKIREAEINKIPYLLVVGEKEQSAGTIAVRQRGSRDAEEIQLESFAERTSEAVKLKQ